MKYEFLNGQLDGVVYVTQTLGFVMTEKENMVYRLHGALYGFKHTPRACNKKIDSYLIELEFTKYGFEYGVYVKSMEFDITLICLYVEDLLVICNNINNLKKFK